MLGTFHFNEIWFSQHIIINEMKWYDIDCQPNGSKQINELLLFSNKNLFIKINQVIVFT